MMRRSCHSTREKTISLADARIRQFGNELNNFFKDSNQSSEILNTLFEQYCPSLSIYEAIIILYANSLYKPTVNKLIDKTIEYLNLNNNENLSKNPYYLQQIKFDEQIENCNLLHHAIMKNHENIFQFLLNSGYNSNSLLSDHKTPLSIAVVTNNIDPSKRLEYIEQLISYGANPIIPDITNNSSFKRLCGMESNYPIVYTFFRDYLLSTYPDQIEIEFNAALKNALYNWCIPIVTDLLEHGAILTELKTIDSFSYFISEVASTIFKEHRSLSYIDRFILCLIQIFLHNNPCENYSVCIKIFFRDIYIPCICFETNNDPFNQPLIKNLKNFIYICFYYGYLTKTAANEIRTQELGKILTIPIQNILVTSTIRQQLYDTLNQYFDELIRRYHHNSVSLRILSIRKIRQLMIKVNQKNIEQLNINRHLKNMLLLQQ